MVAVFNGLFIDSAAVCILFLLKVPLIVVVITHVAAVIASEAVHVMAVSKEVVVLIRAPLEENRFTETGDTRKKIGNPNQTQLKKTK